MAGHDKKGFHSAPKNQVKCVRYKVFKVV